MKQIIIVLFFLHTALAIDSSLLAALSGGGGGYGGGGGFGGGGGGGSSGSGSAHSDKVSYKVALDNDVGKITYDSDLKDLSYSYRMETSDGTSKQESGRFEGENLIADGAYEYIGDNGLKYIVTYVADKDGYRPKVIFGTKN